MLRGSLGVVRISSLIVAAAALGCSSSGSPTKPPAKKDGGSETARKALRIVSTPVQNAQVGEPVHYRVATTFAGAEIVAEQLPQNALLDSTGVLTWTPGEGQSGTQSFRVRATAPDQEATQQFTITAARARVQVSQQVDPKSSQTSTVSVDAPLSPIKGTAVQIQPGSLVETVTHPITISSVENAPVPPAARIAGVPPADMQPVELGPSGIAFRKPVRVQLPVSQAVASRGRPEVQTYDYGTGKWNKVKVVAYDPKSRTVIAEVSHFSTYVATPAANVFGAKLSRGAAGTPCAEALIVRAPIVLPFASIPASMINGYAGKATSLAEVLGALDAGRAVQVLIRAEARTPDGKATESGWMLMSATKGEDGKVKLHVSSNAAGASLLKLPESLGASDPELAAFLSGARSHFVFAKLGSLAGGVVVKLDAALYYVAGEDAARTPPGAVNALASEEIEAKTLAADTATDPGYDQDCDGAPSAHDPIPQGDAPPVLTASPASPLRLTAGGEGMLSVKANVDGVAFTWTGSDPSLGLSAAAGAATIKPSVPGLFQVEVLGKKGTAEARFVWEIVVDSTAVMSRNAPPVVAISAPTTVVRVGERLPLTAVGKDSDGSELTFKWSAKVAGLLSAAAGETVAFTGGTAGDYVVECVANDGLASSTPATVTITVLSATANRAPAPPAVTPLVAALTHEAGVPVEVKLEASAIDPDGDEVTYHFAPDLRVPRSVALASSGATATVTTATDGVFLFYVTAEDSKGAKSPFTTVKVSVAPRATSNTDEDKDGFPQGIDCNDKDATVFPGAREVCGDSVDQSCDGKDLSGGDCDTDGDRYGSAQGDCDDTDPNRNPGAVERCDGVDNNCNRTVDEGFDVGTACTVGLGACQGRGVTACSATFSSVVCTGEAGKPAPETCDGADNDCNGAIDDVTGTAGDSVRSCGGCGLACTSAPNTVAACVAGGCTFRCTDGFADLDRKPENGCECGATNRGVEICDGLDNDCNGSVDEAVSEPFYSGPEGTAGVGVCTWGKRTCQSGRLVVTAEPRLPGAEVCDGLDNDCNGKADETFDLMRDLRNCGGCGNVCQGTCDMGRCVTSTVDAGAPPPYDGGVPMGCAAPRATCTDGRGAQYCADLAWDNLNCGACNNICAAGAVCSQGKCVTKPADYDGGPPPPENCLAPLMVCRDAAGAQFCTDPRRDIRNCGGCGNVCPGGTSCYEGRCVMDGSTSPDGGAPPVTCMAPMIMCKDATGTREYCTDPSRDPANCGGCGRYCQSGMYCSGGQCLMMMTYDGGAPPPPTCTAPMALCKDPSGTREYCSDLTRDASNCGSCGKVCAPGEYCVNGACGTMAPPVTCMAPMMLCKDASGTREYCADTTRDHANCGGCGKPCSADQICMNATCVAGMTYDGGAPPVTCMAPMMLCKDATGTREYCADTTRDQANCGRCGNVCPGGTSCMNGQCATTTTYDGGAPPPPTCAAPSMICRDPSGREYCADTTTDPLNCGACGMVCGSGFYCARAQCVSMTTTQPPACMAPMMMCKDPSGKEYCSDPMNDNFNCGTCGVVCGAGTTCKEGKCTDGATRLPTSCAQPMVTCMDPTGAQYCADLTVDAKNCGKCQNACPSGICKDGTCVE